MKRWSALIACALSTSAPAVTVSVLEPPSEGVWVAVVNEVPAPLPLDTKTAAAPLGRVPKGGALPSEARQPPNVVLLVLGVIALVYVLRHRQTR